MADDERSLGEEEEEVMPAQDSSTSVSPLTDAVAPGALAAPKYEVLPALHERFKSLQIKEVINSTMSEQLLGRSYRADLAAKWPKQIANVIRQRVEKLCMNRYKILVLVSVAESRGAGLTSALRCLWDPDSDSYVHDSFQNSSLYAHTTVFGVYLY